MEVALSPLPAATVTFDTNPKFSINLSKTPVQAYNFFPRSVKLKSQWKKKHHNRHFFAFSSGFNIDNFLVLTSPLPTPSQTTRIGAASMSTSVTFTRNRHWRVVMDIPPEGLNSKSQIIDYYVQTLQSVLGSEKNAQMCIYDASWETDFSFCCDIDEDISRELARLPGVLSVGPDPNFDSAKDDCKNPEVQFSPPLNALAGSNLLFPAGNTKHWIVRMDMPETGVVSKAQMVDYYTHILTKVMGNKEDAQMCIYHVSWQSNFGFCCELDEECARELAGVSGVLSVQPDEDIESFNKDYGGKNSQHIGDSPDSPSTETTDIKTKKLFVAGLSFYTSEKTLRAAFEGFGELVGVKIIMDKISKRSKGYAFVEYTTEKAATMALQEMNGKIINGWMISVDVARNNPPKYSSGRPRPAI